MEAAAAEVEAEQLQEQQEQHLQGNETPGHQSTGCLSPIPESSRDFQAYPKSSPARMAKRAETVPSHQFMQAMIDSSPEGRSPFMGVDEAAAATSPPLVMPPPNYAQSAGGSSLSADGRSNCRSASLRRSTGKGIQDLQEGVPVAEQLGLSGRIDDVDFDELQLGKFLGAGAEGAVYAAWYNETPVAVKKTTNVHEVVMHVLAGLHDNIVSARAVALHEGELLVVMEYCPRGTLDTMIHHTMGGSKKGAPAGAGWDPMRVVLPMVRSIARGILHLHRRSNPILHRDIKPGNIFVSHGLVMKIGDFGMSREVEGSAATTAATGPKEGSAVMRRTFTSGVVGTSEYSAPELLGSTPEDKESTGETMLKADVYSFGVTLWEILTRSRPFAGMGAFEIQTGWLVNPEEMQLPAVKVDPTLTGPARRVMEELAKLVVDCTAAEPARRPSAKDIVGRIRQAGATDTAV